MKKYTWTYNEDDEIWRNDTYDTIEECLEAARLEGEKIDWDGMDRPAHVYVGECHEFIPCVDGEYVLDNIQEQAGEFAGDAGYDWDACDYRKREEIEELNKQLSDVVIAWQKKYGYEPCFYAVNDSKRYDLHEASHGQG